MRLNCRGPCVKNKDDQQTERRRSDCHRALTFFVPDLGNTFLS